MKGQAATEYLIMYGVAIGIAVGIIGGIVFLASAFDQVGRDVCSAEPFVCAFSIEKTEDGVNMSINLTNPYTYDIYLQKVEISVGGTSKKYFQNVNIEPRKNVGETKSFGIKNKKNVKGIISIEYCIGKNQCDPNNTHKTKGIISGRVK